MKLTSSVPFGYQFGATAPRRSPILLASCIIKYLTELNVCNCNILRNGYGQRTVDLFFCPMFSFGNILHKKSPLLKNNGLVKYNL